MLQNRSSARDLAPRGNWKSAQEFLISHKSPERVLEALFDVVVAGLNADISSMGCDELDALLAFDFTSLVCRKGQRKALFLKHMEKCCE